MNMKRRLTQAYDAMAMPDDCARRIEGELEYRQTIRGRHTSRACTPAKGNLRTVAAGLVCLAILTGGMFLGIRVLGTSRTPDTAAAYGPGDVAATEATYADDDFVFQYTGQAFLEKMCAYMPDWSENADLDTGFWNAFLFASFTCPELREDGTAQTIAGAAAFVDQSQVKIAWEQVNAYVRLALGQELPEDFRPSQEGLAYEDGYFYITVSDFGSAGYTLRSFDPDGDNAVVTFAQYVDEPENVVGTVTFVVHPAENENGFTISGKESVFTGEDALGLADAVEGFARAYFYGTPEELTPYLADDYTGSVTVYTGPDTALLVGYGRGLPSVGQTQVGDMRTVSYAFKESAEVDSYTYLTLELVKQENGWRIRFYGLEK